ncbi:LuxR C-terminal-related transcriptional regulator [Sphingobium sp. BYY-5]|uniref:LuxR C-terminal-related transcriptional regulator n=1 Tax=Sphingobium sp. BYY-5 TaxID=2926400 RepID=UPI001FA6C38B|nr:LuxR C-terminal-related transcriptional regulator [Sphingobium sp. BYY-5]MCI4589571.1 LuxR C-terminal-related transcriptional regulator [Sphingobium sp. BYY-5]
MRDIVSQRTEGLSEKQKLCLRLVGQGLSSKEIAPIAETTYGVVDNIISTACLKIGVRSRREAARILLAEENSGVQQLHVQPVGVASASIADDERVQAEQQPGVLATLKETLAALFRLPPIGGRANDLNNGERVLAMARITFVCALLLIAAVVIVQGIAQLLI